MPNDKKSALSGSTLGFFERDLQINVMPWLDFHVKLKNYRESRATIAVENLLEAVEAQIDQACITVLLRFESKYAEQ